MGRYPTQIPEQPVRNLQSMAGRGGTGIEHDDEHVLIFEELIALAARLGITDGGAAVMQRLKNIEFARSLKASYPNIVITGSAPFIVTIPVSSSAWVPLRNQPPNFAYVTRTAGGSPGVWPVAASYSSNGENFEIHLPGTGTWTLTLQVV